MKHEDAVHLIDSTTIYLCKQQFNWATFRSGKAGVKVHTAYDPKANVPTFFSITEASKHDKKAAEEMPLLDGATYVFDRAYNDYAWYYNMDQRDIRFVGRMKSNARFNVVKELESLGEGVLKDEIIRLSSAKAQSDCLIKLRRILGKVNIGGKVQYCSLQASVLLKTDLMNAVCLLNFRLIFSQRMRLERPVCRMNHFYNKNSIYGFTKPTS